MLPYSTQFFSYVYYTICDLIMQNVKKLFIKHKKLDLKVRNYRKSKPKY
jgi:hypothetical protein